jgi:nanoRNase/pAp phosphatase (c-di-AMP/oligoRNAs hydrolase)
MPIDWKPLIEIVREYDHFVISSHVRPDADAIGSELGLACVLESLGKSVLIANPSASPDGLAFLDPDKRAKKLGDGITPDDVRNADVHLIVDTSAWVQLQEVGNVFRNSKAKRRAVIDHHASSDNLGALEFKDVTAAATGELIFEFAEAIGAKLTAPAANALFCAIATDTGWFRFPSTASRTLAIAARLIDLGAQPHVLYQALYEQHSSARMRLFGRVLCNLTIDSEGRLAYLSVSQKDFAETGAVPADTEELVNECLKVAGVKAAFIAIEQQNQTVKVSFRSRLEINVASVAELFGGGGHKQAAGAVLSGTLGDALAKILPPMQELVAL